MRKFIFTATTGRSGTMYLANLLAANLPSAEVHHELMGWTRLGVDTPDASHFTLFNSVGNVPQVSAFWHQKLSRVAGLNRPVYAETSHSLMKAGLFENIETLTNVGEVEVVVLTRDVKRTLWSFLNRFDFANLGFTWLFYLDPRYPNKLVNSEPLMKFGAMGAALWYIFEIRARSEYYKLLLADQSGINCVTIDLSEIVEAKGAARLLSVLDQSAGERSVILPERANELKQHILSEDIRAQAETLVDQTFIDPAQIAQRFFENGRRLANGAPGKS